MSVYKKKNLLRKIKNNIKLIKKVSKLTGWNFVKAKYMMQKAKKQYNVSYRNYIKWKFYNKTNEEQAIYVKKRIEREARNTYLINKAATLAGWSFKETKDKMDITHKEYGVSYKHFIKFKFYKNFNIALEEYLIRQEELSGLRKERIEKIGKETGWPVDKIIAEVNAARKYCQVTYKDYANFKFYQLTKEEQARFFTYNHNVKLREKYNLIPYTSYFINKINFNLLFKNYIGRKWWTNRNTTFEEFNKFVEGLDVIICKPINLTQGLGVKKIDLMKTTTNLELFYQSLLNEPAAIFEELIIQHKDLADIYPHTVNTIRVFSLLDHNKCHILFAVWRMGVSSDIVDNFHQGGIMAVVDLKSGEVSSDAFNLDGDRYETHPVTKRTIKGRIIPYWQQCMNMVTEAAFVMPQVGYIGWDIAIMKDRPILIEGNTAPDYALIQLPYAEEKIGMKHLIEKFLPGDYSEVQAYHNELLK
jgi:hypothetical protein